MAMPMMAGPGAIAAIMLLMNQANGIEESSIVFLAAGLVLLVTMLSLIAARPLMNLLGTKVEAAITRLLGVLLAALASQFVIDGVRGTLIAQI